MLEQDKLLRFSFDGLDIRGELVYLDDSWTSVLSHHAYPPSVRKHLGDALAAVTLLSATVKFTGNMILQVQGEGPLRSVVTQISSAGELRGLARWEGTVPDSGLREAFGEGRMLITIIKQGGERYQSIVALEGPSLAEALNLYFQQSEQLPSSFRLYVNEARVSGLFLQALPPGRATGAVQALAEREEHWQRINLLAATLSEVELMNLPADRILHNLFHEEDLRLHPPRPLRFACTCSREKVERTLIAMGEPELRSILVDEGHIKVDCEFCNRHFEFTALDVHLLFHQPELPDAGKVLH